MARTFIFKSNAKSIAAFHIAIGNAAIRAATMVVWRRAKMNARKGFKGGRFKTNGWNSVRFAVKKGVRPIGQVGSTLDHFAYWELGHQNRYTRQYERNRWLSNAFRETKGAQKTAVKIAVRKVVGSAPAVLRKSFIAGLTGRAVR